MNKLPDSGGALTAGLLIERTAANFASADLYYGHGTDNPHDEAAALVFHVMKLDHSGTAAQYTTVVTSDQLADITSLAQARVEARTPLPYLLGEAWFAGMRFHVDPSVLIPRSPIAELISAHFEPWIDAANVRAILEIGTGSGCIAISCATTFPAARVVATDISADALAVAQRNVARHAVDSQVRLVATDYVDGITETFDLIVTNPPYVPSSQITGMPAEYHHEPELGLASGADGLDSARRILKDAARLLRPEGVLVIEVGDQWQALEEAFPQLPFNWLEFEFGGLGVGLLYASALKS